MKYDRGHIEAVKLVIKTQQKLDSCDVRHQSIDGKL